MSRRIGVCFLAMIAVTVPRATRAQIAAHWSVAAGASLPTSSFGDTYDTGYHVLAAIGLQPALSPVGFRIDGMFNEFNRSNLTNSKVRVLGLTANAVLATGGIGPYLIGGLGAYSNQYRPGTGSSSDVGFNIGGGFRFGLTGFSVFAEARYHRVADAAQFIPITFGITF